MKAGAWIGIGLIASALIGGAAIFYLQAFYYYKPVKDLPEIRIGGLVYPLSAYDGLDDTATPLRLRGCFTLEEGADAAAEAIALTPKADRAEPFGAPFWFDCWDPARIAADIASGEAVALSAERGGEGDFAHERVVALYPDGRGYQWRRLQPPPTRASGFGGPRRPEALSE